uniref:ESPR-type extended signal peptide-containing protein n=1 Tax=Acinetobacter parvus TaxID=134533 RepID=UPI002CFDA1BB
MNHIFKKIWNKSLGRMIVVSENAKSAGKTDNTTGIQQNSLSNVHDDEQGKNFVFSFKPLVLKSLVLSIAAITGVNVWADDNYAHTSTDTALGSATGLSYISTNNGTTLTSVAGITVTSTSLNMDDIDSFTVGGIKETDPVKVAAFKNAAKKGGNIAVGQYSSAVGTGNIASGSYSSAVGSNNTVSGAVSSAVGYGNAASGFFSNAIGGQNSASKTLSNAIGSRNQATGTLSNAIGSGINNALIVPGAGGVITSIDDIPITTTATSVAALRTNNITAIDGNTNPTFDEKRAFIDAVQKGQNRASGVAASAAGVSNNASGAGSNAVGLGNTASGITSSALGYNNTALGYLSSAVGYNNTASGSVSSALGHVNNASGVYSTAVGSNNLALGYVSSAFGYRNTASGAMSSALGYTNAASGDHSTAVGSRNVASAIASSALGHRNQATGFGSIAVGNGFGAPSEASINGNTITYGSGSSVTTIVTSSSVSANSDLSNVTANDIVSINGNTTLTLAQKQVFLDYVQGWSKSNISSGIASSAVGVINNATGVGSSAVGFNNTASATNSSVFGVGSQATAQNATAIGYDSLADKENTISVGRAGAEKQITNVAAGTQTTDAVNKKQLDDGLAAKVDQSALFNPVTGILNPVTGLPSKIGYDTPTVDKITLRGTGGTTISNVAAGTLATDAVNKGQLDTAILSVSGGTVATDNYTHTSTETALGSAKGTPHATTTTAGKITAVGGITVTTDLATAGISIDDINSFTVGGVITTKAADPAKVAAFINAAKKGGNIAVGQLSSAVGTANIASGNNSSAVGSNNTASSNNSSALGYGNTASNLYSNALGYRNTASNLYSNALGSNNNALGWSSSSVGLGNLTTQFASSAFGFFNAAVAESSTAMGSGINGSVSSRLRTLEEKVENGKLVSVNGVAVTATGNTTATITHVNGVAVDENQKSQFLNILRQGNVAAGQYSSAMGVRNLATGVDSSAFGYGNDATANQSSVFGSNSQATAQGATAIGFNSLANEANTVSVGRSGAEKRITNVADAVNAKDAANKGYVDTALSNFTGNADAVLYDTGTNKATLILAGTSGTKITNLQNATLSDISTDAVTGQQLKATNDVVAGKASQTDLTTGLAAKADKTAFDSLNNKVTDAATGLDSKASTTALTTGLSSTLADAKTYADTGLATKADQTALTTGLANTLTDAKGYTDVEVGKLDTKLGTEVGNLNTAITNSANTINTRIDGVDTRIGNEV